MALWEEADYGVIADRSSWAMFAVLLVVVSLRVYCRLLIGPGPLGGLGIDDYITVLCLVVFFVTCILVTLGSSHGLGKHMLELDPAEIPEALRYNEIISAVLIWSFSLPKFAIIATLKRILNYGKKTTAVFWTLALTSQACILATSVWWFAQCQPVARGWDRTVEGTCADVSVLANLGYFTSAYSAFLDIFFALYPIPFIMRLHMPLKSRIAVSIALGLSVLACVVSIYKLAIFGQVFEILAKDPTYPVPYLDILGLAEGCILIVCASLPTFGPLVRIIRPKLTSLRSSRSKSETGQEQRSPSTHSSTGTWSKIRGHKVDDGESHTAVQSSQESLHVDTMQHEAGYRMDSL